MDRLLDLTLPEVVRRDGVDIARRARVVLIACAISAVVSFYIAAVQLAVGSRVAGVATLGLGVLSIAGIVDIRRSGRWRRVGGALTFGIFAAAATTTALSGATLTAAAFYLCLVPLLATMIFGARAGGATAFLNVAVLCTVELARRRGVHFPYVVTHEVAAESAFRAAILFELILLGIAVIYDHLRSASLREVAESEARHLALGAQSTDLLFELDPDGRIAYATPVHAGALGWRPEELIGRPASDFVHPEDHDEIPRRIAEALTGGSSHGNDVRLRAKDGTWHWYEPAMTSYRAAEAEPRLIVVARDLSLRHEFEAQLRQSQKMDAVGQLASGVAHDFNNLLMVVASYAELLAERLPTGEDRDAAEEILRAAAKGEGLTRQLLAVSRPSASTPDTVQLNDVVRGIQGILTRLVGESVQVEVALDAALPAVHADAGHLEQILVNLAVNARDAMPSGGRLEIATHARDGAAALRIADTGVGMDETVRERAFEAFFTTKQRHSGTGLGLYVVYSVVSQMDGGIRVESAPGEGTAIEIELPAATESAAVAVAAPASASPATGGDETVLVVEDRAEVRAAVCTALRRAGYRVLEARDGAHGLAVARAFAGGIDLVLSDVVMPSMSGPRMMRELRAERPGTRVLYMSGHVDRLHDYGDELADEALVLKPIAPSALLARVRG
ncbi:MAG: PAS domain S-box protein, partial [Myxococcales bacterium]|nr:PAS domain S-box protein [Myxococcales bacterium]